MRLDYERAAAGALLVTVMAIGCRRVEPSFVRVRGPRTALIDVNLVDGTGSPARPHETVIIEGNQIAAAGPNADTAIPDGAEVLRLSGYTVIPGFVGMHDHLFYAAEGGSRTISIPRSFARLYLAAGVTSIRTAGASNLESDIDLKREVDQGRAIGPRIHLSSDYIATHSDVPTLIRRIDILADSGVTSLKIYTDVGRDQLAVAIAHAHRRGLKVTGHLCAVGFRQAAALGIDNLEHGLIVDTEFVPWKVPDQCPDLGSTVSEFATMKVGDPRIQQTIRELVTRRVAITSTLAVFETFARPTSIARRVAPLLTRTTFAGYSNALERAADLTMMGIWEKALKLEMKFERAFVTAGGVLMAGADPTGWGGVVAGIADQRNLELLVEAGFTVEQAVHIATINGAELLGEGARIGTIEPGKRADLAVVRGDLAADIRNINNTDMVFKDGVGFDAAGLMAAERGHVGETNWRTWTAAGIGIAAFVLLVARAQVSRSKQKARNPPRPGGETEALS